MYVTNIRVTKGLDATPEELKGKASSTIWWLLGEPEGAPNFELRYITLSVSSASPNHNHPWEHEVFVIKGKGKVVTDEGEKVLNAHDAVFVAPGEQHQFVNISPDESFDFICVVPKGTR